MGKENKEYVEKLESELNRVSDRLIEERRQRREAQLELKAMKDNILLFHGIDVDEYLYEKKTKNRRYYFQCFLIITADILMIFTLTRR